MIDATEEPPVKSGAATFPTFAAVGRFFVRWRMLARPYLPRYRLGRILLGVLFVLMIGSSGWEYFRTRPTRELYRALAQRMVAVDNIDRNTRNYRRPIFLRRFLTGTDEANDTVNLIFRGIQTTRETAELCCRLQLIHSLSFNWNRIKPDDLKPFLAHPEIRGLNFNGCSLTDEEFASILENFPNVRWIALHGTFVTDKSADVLIERHINLINPPEFSGFSKAASARLKAAKLTR